MKKENRIKKSQEIDRVIKAKKSVGNKYFVIYRLFNSETINYRFAISIGKKYGIAVLRNRIKRQIREVVSKMDLPTMDYVIVVKPNARELSFQDILSNIKYLFNKEV